MTENKPGDGKTSPFGNGKGDVGMSGSSKGNDFTKNPQGSGGKKSGGGQPESYGQSREQKKGSDPVNSEDKATGPKTAAEVVTPGTGERQGMIGTSADKAAHKPFKLSGG